MFDRYAIYYTATGAFASTGAAWLGWDIATGQPVPHPKVDGLDVEALTQAPRTYGFHGTMKAPFYLANGCSEDGLRAAFADVAARLAPVHLPRLEVAALGRFLALVPVGDAAALRGRAATVVRDLDAFRAPMTSEELTRKNKPHLSPAQREHLLNWGYPHVMEHFRFHMTLTGRMPKTELAQARDAVQDHFAPVLPQPFCVDALTLVGQRGTGGFQTLARVALTGAGSTR